MRLAPAGVFGRPFVLTLTLLTLLAAAGLVACGTAKKAGGNGLFGALVDKETVHITAAEGGDVTLDNGATASIPGQALTDDADVTNAQYEPGEGVSAEAVSYVYNVTPETAVGLNGRYHLSLPYDPTKVMGRALQLMHRHFDTSADAEGATADDAVVSVNPFADDRQNGVVTADVDSFGAYWVAALDTAQPDAAVGPVKDADVVPDAGDAAVGPRADAAAPKPDAVAPKPDAALPTPDAAVAANNPLLGAVTETQTVTFTAAAGGSATLASGLSVTVPAGVLAADVPCTVAEYAAGDPISGGAASGVLLVTPDTEGVTIQGQIRISVPYSVARLAGRALRVKQRVYASTAEALGPADGTIEDRTPIQNNPATHVASVQATAFGAFWVSGE